MISCGAASSVGRVRESNEDSCLVDVGARFFLVADGMGGHAAGEVASALAVSSAARFLTANGPASEAMVIEAVRVANRAVLEAARANPSQKGMGTTFVALVGADDGSWIVAHVGDSRCYELRGTAMTQITEDHSFGRHVLARAVGIDADVQVDTAVRPGGARFLLCSDGLNGEIGSEAIRHLLISNSSPKRAAGALVRAAERAGGRDNITAIVVDTI